MQADTNRAYLEALPASEWARLVRLCAHISGSVDAAEDLAQETLIEAWRHSGNLRDPHAHRAWLAGIARNVALRWRRQQAREHERQQKIETRERANPNRAVAFDTELAVMRAELESLLDRALAKLPDATRDVLVLRYLDDLSNREIAACLSLSEGAVAVRLHRGKAALRQAFAAPALRDEAATFGLVDPSDSGWRQTRIWCPFCGRHRLKTRIDPNGEMLFAICEGPCIDAGAVIGGASMHPATRKLTSIKSIVSRELIHLHDFYRTALVQGGHRCYTCGRFLPLAAWHPEQPSPIPTAQPHGILMRCAHCGDESSSSASLWHLLIDTPEAQHFWRKHPRIEALPIREVERDGQAALVSGFTSVGENATLEFVTSRESFDLIHVGGTGAR